jgi:hypothetical protein
MVSSGWWGDGGASSRPLHTAHFSPFSCVPACRNVANTSITQLPPPKSAAQLAKDVLTAERDRIRAQLGARAGGAAAGGPKPAAQPKAAAAAPRERQVRTLEEYEAERAGSSNSSASRLGRAGSPASSAAAAPEAAAAAPAANAWARARAGSGASLGDPSEWSQAPSSRADTPVGGHPPAPAAAAAALQPQGAWAQKQAAAGVLAASLPAAPRPGAGAAAAVGDTEPVDPATAARVPGMDSPPADRGAAAPLTKAQRKNAKRAEKKAAAGARPEDDDADAPELGSLYSALPDVSPLADPQFTVADAAAVLEGAAPGGGGGGGSGPAAAGPSALPVDMFDQCLQLVVQHRLQAQVAQLEAVGFAGGAAVAAVRAAGGDLAAAVEALLSPGVGAWGGAGERDVDVSAELGVLRALRERYRLPAGVVEAVVVDCSGDLVATAALLAEQCEEQPATPPAPHYHDPQQYAAGGGGGVDWGAPDSGGAASAGGGAYSAFAFGGLTEAALTAVHGAGSMFTASVEGTPSAHSAGTPLHQPDSRSGGGGGLWGDYPGAAGSGSGGRGGCHATTAADGGLLAMLGVSGGGGFGAPAPAPAHLAAYSPPGALGGYGSQQWGAEALQPVHQQQQQHGMAAHDQQWGGGQGGGLWGVQGGGVAAGPAPAGLFGAPMQQPQHASQSQELNDLMATLMCS